MRDLRFRVWNGSEMEYNVIVGKFGAFFANPENGNGLNPEDTACLTQNTTKYPDTIPVMQFTGMYDRDKNEIWEGDIVAFERERNFKKEFVLPIVMEMQDYDNNGVGWTQFSPREAIVVIGNIYANPELLNG